MTIATTICGDMKRHKEVSEGNVWCCGEYAECEYLIDVLSIANLEIGLRWLHDKSSRCNDCGRVLGNRRLTYWPLHDTVQMRKNICPSCFYENRIPIVLSPPSPRTGQSQL